MACEKKTILILSYTPDDWEGYRNVLEPVFEGEDIALSFEAFSVLGTGQKEADIVLVASRFFASFAKQMCSPQTPILWMNHTIDKQIYQELAGICRRERISIASDAVFYSTERKIMLTNLGLPEDSLMVWEPSFGEDELENTVVAFERTKIGSANGKRVYRVEGRGRIAMDTMFALCLTLGRLDLMKKPAMQRYFESICHSVRQADDIVNITDHIQMLNTGNGLLMFFWPNPVIYLCDHNAELLLNRDRNEIIGKTISEVFPFLKGKQEQELRNCSEQIILLNKKRTVFKLVLMETHDLYVGVIVISDYGEEARKELRLRRQVMDKKHSAKYTFDTICGESPQILACKRYAKQMAKADANIVITGPSGCGKELFAQAIHNASGRKNNPFVSVNCGAIVDSLLESELFGYEAGAFTGAKKEGKMGLFELAHKGTLFLDEIAEMPLALQVKLLRVLQEREVVRVGGQEVIPIDVRIIAATNRDLRQMVRDGSFRLDLYYRLNVLPLRVPSLNERKGDILLLIKAFQKGYRKHFVLAPDAERALMSHDYEGNVRELQNCVEYLTSLGGAEIRLEDLPPYIFDRGAEVKTGCGRTKDLVYAAIQDINRMGMRAGRRSICQCLKQKGEWISEAKVRAAIQELECEGRIEVSAGRGGIVLTEQSH